MRKLLIDIGIKDLNSFIYEYEPTKLDWWDSENNTSIEIETHQDKEGLIELRVIFAPEAKGIIERTIIFIAFYKDNSLDAHAFITKKASKYLIPENNFEFSEKQNSFIINSAKYTKVIFAKILKIIKNKKPIHIVDLKQIVDETVETPCKAGETLKQFITMMNMNSIEFTKENIVNSIGVGVQFEGKKYLIELNNDLNSELNYNIDNKTFQLIKETIKDYNKSLLNY